MKSLRPSIAIRKPVRTLPRVGAMKTMRTSLVIAAVAAGLIAAAGPAQAIPLPTDPNQTVHLLGRNTEGDNGFCQFPVTIEIFSVQKVTRTTLPNGAEEFRSTGHAKAIVTRDGGESITYNISGPGTVTFSRFPNTDVDFTIDAAGPNLLWTTVKNSAPGVPQIAYTTGRVQVEVDETGKTTNYQLNGRSTDVCAELTA